MKAAGFAQVICGINQQTKEIGPNVTFPKAIITTMKYKQVLQREQAIE